MQRSPASGLALRKCEKLTLTTLRNALLSSRKKVCLPRGSNSYFFLRTSLDYLLWLQAKIVYLGHRFRSLINKSKAWVCCGTISCKRSERSPAGQPGGKDSTFCSRSIQFDLPPAVRGTAPRRPAPRSFQCNTSSYRSGKELKILGW